MKKILIIFSIVLFSSIGYSQAVAEYRVANATTKMPVNLSVANKVYNIATGEYWVVTAAVDTTKTLTTASGSFTQLNAGTAALDLSLGTVTATTVDINISGGGASVTIPASNTDDAGLMTDTQFDKLDALAFDGNNLDMDGDVKAKTFTSVVLTGAKTANFTHDAVAASRGAYRVNLADLTLSIHNLTNGMGGVVKLNYHTTTVTSLTVNFYSDAGSTQYNSTTHVTTLGNDAAPEVDKKTAVYYECDNDGTNTTVTVVYGQE